jgi:hypothetical protein
MTAPTHYSRYNPIPAGEARELDWFEAEAALITYFGWQLTVPSFSLAPTDNPWHKLADRHADKEWAHERVLR